MLHTVQHVLVKMLIRNGEMQNLETLIESAG